jgi:hypothetical protein
MEEICMFEYDPVFGSFGHPSSGCEFDAIAVIAKSWILRALKPKGDRGTQEESQRTALTCSRCPREEDMRWIGSCQKCL